MKKLFCLLLALLTFAVPFGFTAAAADEAEPEAFLLPVMLGEELRVDNELTQIYYVPQYVAADAFYRLLQKTRDDLYFEVVADTLLNGMYLVSGARVSVAPSEDEAGTVYTVQVKGDIYGTGTTTTAVARQALRLAVGLDAGEYARYYRALDVDGDNRMTPEDARYLLRVAIGLENLGAPGAFEPEIPEEQEDPAPQEPEPQEPEEETETGRLDGDVVYYPESGIPLKYSGLAAALNGFNASAKTTVAVKNLRGSPEESWQITVTQADRAQIRALFSRLPKDATNLEKIYAAYKYIQKSFSYARSYELYSRIWSKTPIDAVFNEHLAQCLQYNGAMAEVLAYMGYDTALVEGMRGQGDYSADTVSYRWSHYWTELYLDGETYLIEVGQPEDRWNGAFMVRYADSDHRYLYYNTAKGGYSFLR